MEKYLKKYHYLFFFGLAIFLLYPTFRSGYIFLLDWTVTPQVSWSDINFGVDSITAILSRIFSIFFSFELFQRFFLMAIIFFLGLGGFRLAKRTENVYAQYFSGLFFIFNPFIYARLVEQPGIAAGSAALFWFLIYLLEYLEDRKTRKIAIASVCAGLAISFFLHSAFFIAVALLIILTFDYFKRKDSKFLLKILLAILLAIFVINGNWIITSLFKLDEVRLNAIGSFTQEDVETFATRNIGGGSVYTTVLSLQGYWGEYQDRFVSIQDNPFWQVFFGAIFFVCIFGLVKIWKKDYLGKGMVVIFSVAYVLAIGIAASAIKPVALFLYENVPFYIGLRESQKWAVLMVFVYAFLGGWGVASILKLEKIKNYRREIGIFLALLPVMFSFPAIYGMHSHLTPLHFPKEWKEAKDLLYRNSYSGKVLFFPWHAYMEISFVGKNVTVPARPFFGKNVIQGNNTEFGKIYSHSCDEQTLAIEKYVFPKDGIDYENFPEDMGNWKIGKVLLAKEEDWHNYSWLDRIDIVRKVMENEKIIVYEILQVIR